MPTANSTRLDYLDAVRAFALILGIVFHASLSFMPIFIGWAVMDISTSHMVSIFVMISHAFRMELFFLIAGFFAHMKLQQQGVVSFLKSRFVRLGIPFVLGWIILRPLIVSGWTMGADSMRGDVDVLASLIAGFASLGSLPDSLLVGTHLWFLYYLLIVSCGVIMLRALLGTNTGFLNVMTKAADNTVYWLSKSGFGLLIMAVPTAFCLWFMQRWGVDTPDQSLIPHVPVTLLYGGFFVFGWLMHRQAPALEEFSRIRWRNVAWCVIAMTATVQLSEYEANWGHPDYSLFKAAFLFSYAIMMWTLVSLILGIGKRLFSRASKTVRYLADASYWLYLIHLPLVVWLQTAFAELPFHWTIKLLSICTITLALSVVLYDVLVRPTFIGAVLNGKTRKRVLFASKEDKKGLASEL